ncbi:MAG TPA: hypothetical protein VKU85_19615 [bacterium]|nr:hypothetical protein [bacterium]
MRWIRSVVLGVSPEEQDRYLERIDAFSRAAVESGRVKGFYLVESADRPGEFQEFWEYADRDHARAHARELDGVDRGIRERAGGAPVVSDWQQRL